MFAIFSESQKSWFAFGREPALHIEFVDSSLRGHFFKSFVLFNRRKGNSPWEREFGQNLNLSIQKNRKRINDVFLNIVDNKEQRKNNKGQQRTYKEQQMTTKKKRRTTKDNNNFFSSKRNKTRANTVAQN